MSPPPRSAAKGKAPADASGGAGGGPQAMDVDARPGPATPATAHAAMDEVVAEYELVLCEPAGGPDTEVCVMSFPLVPASRVGPGSPDPGVAGRLLCPLAARVKPRARKFEADVAAVGVPSARAGDGDAYAAASSSSSSEGEEEEEEEEEASSSSDGEGAAPPSTSSSDGGGRRRRRARRRARPGSPGGSDAPAGPRTVTLAGVLTPTGGRKALAALRGGRLLITPVDSSLALLPCLGGGGGGGRGATPPPGPPPSFATPVKAEGGAGPSAPAATLTPVTVRVNRRETERQVEAREASYAHLAETEGREAWVPVAAAGGGAAPPPPAGGGARRRRGRRGAGPPPPPPPPPSSAPAFAALFGPWSSPGGPAPPPAPLAALPPGAYLDALAPRSEDPVAAAAAAPVPPLSAWGLGGGRTTGGGVGPDGAPASPGDVTSPAAGGPRGGGLGAPAPFLPPRPTTVVRPPAPAAAAAGAAALATPAAAAALASIVSALLAGRATVSVDAVREALARGGGGGGAHPPQPSLAPAAAAPEAALRTAIASTGAVDALHGLYVPRPGTPAAAAALAAGGVAGVAAGPAAYATLVALLASRPPGGGVRKADLGAALRASGLEVSEAALTKVLRVVCRARGNVWVLRDGSAGGGG